MPEKAKKSSRVISRTGRLSRHEEYQDLAIFNSLKIRVRPEEDQMGLDPGLIGRKIKKASKRVLGLL